MIRVIQKHITPKLYEDTGEHLLSFHFPAAIAINIGPVNFSAPVLLGFGFVDKHYIASASLAGAKQSLQLTPEYILELVAKAQKQEKER